jgi:hypothetical protein
VTSVAEQAGQVRADPAGRTRDQNTHAVGQGRDASAPMRVSRCMTNSSASSI